MGKNKDGEPDEQNRVVETDTPEKNVLEINRRHNTPPTTKRKKVRTDKVGLIYSQFYSRISD